MGVAPLEVDQGLARYLIAKLEKGGIYPGLQKWSDISAMYKSDVEDGFDPKSLPPLTPDDIARLQNDGFINSRNAQALTEKIAAHTNAPNDPQAQSAWNATIYDPSKNEIGQRSTLDPHIESMTKVQMRAPNGEADFRQKFNIAAGTTGADSLKMAAAPEKPTLAQREAQLIEFAGRSAIADKTKAGITPYLEDKDGSILERQRDFAIKLCPDNDAANFLKGNFNTFAKGVQEYQAAQLAEKQQALALSPAVVPAAAGQSYSTPGAGRN